MCAWYDQSNVVVVLEVPGERELEHLVPDTSIQVREPDMQNALTAVGYVPSEAARKATRKLRLAHT